MIVDDFHVVGVAIGPAEDDAPLVVDANRMKARPRAGTLTRQGCILGVMKRALLLALAMAWLVSVACGCGSSRRREGGDGGPRPDVWFLRDAGAGDARPLDGSSGGFHYCPGFEGPSGIAECRGDTECECGSCVIGDICGGLGCASLCATDTDCDGGICTGGCCPTCIPPCPTTPCGPDATCNTATGRCDPVSCSAGYACPVNTRCTPTAPGHGCVRLTCVSDADCDCGTCAEGRCWERPGWCCPPLPG